MIMSMIYDHSRSMLAIPFPLPYPPTERRWLPYVSQ